MKTKYSSIILLLILLFFCSVLAFAQDPVKLRHESELFIIDGDSLFIKGSLEHAENNTNVIFNLGDIFLSDSLINNGEVNIFGTLPDTAGRYIFNGDQRQIIDGKSIYLSFAYLQNTFDSLRLEADTIFINAQLVFDNGNLDVDSQLVFLNRVNYNGTIIEGSLVNEDADDNAFGYPGYVVIDRRFTTGSVLSNVQGTGLDLNINGSLGELEIRRYNQEQASASNTSIERFFEFYPTTADQVSAPGIFYFDPTNLNGNNEDSLNIYLSQDGGLSYRDQGGDQFPNLDKVTLGPAFTFTLAAQTRLTLSEDSCKTLPPLNIVEDTIPLCSGASAYIKADGTTGMEIFWSTGELNVDSIQVSTPGKYGLVIVDEKGCPNRDSVEVIAAPDPVVGFRALPVCDGDTVEFTDTSSISFGNILSRKWQFGDPFSTKDSSSQLNPKYRYKQFGTFQTKLKITSNYGCAIEVTKPIVILPQPTADFSFTGACEGQTYQFTDQSNLPGQQSGGLTYQWSFGDNDSSQLASPSHLYDSAAIFTVDLLVQSNGCVDSIRKTVAVNDIPTAAFNTTNVCEGIASVFTNSSAVNSGTLAYRWDLGNGAVSLDTNPVETYADTGKYQIQLVATSSFGCADSIIDSLIINEVPKVNFSFTNACLDDSVVFTNGSQNASSNLTYSWNFGSQTSALENPKIKFTNNGNYLVKLVAINDSLCSDSITKTVGVYEEPTASFTVNDICEGSTAAFQNTSTINAGNLSYKWFFGNGDSSTAINPNKAYVNAGQYQVQLIASTANACLDTFSTSITVDTLPNVFIGDTLTTCGTSLVLDPSNVGTNYLWSGGQNTQSITAVNNGTYTVTVTDGNGCSASDDAFVTLFTPLQVNLPTTIASCDSLILRSQFPSSGNSFIWSTTATTNNIVVRNSGTYSVTITDQNQCTGTGSSQVSINTSPVVDLGIDQTSCADTAIVFDAANAGSNYLWSNGANSQSITVSTQGRYSVTVTDGNGCTGIDEARARFNALPIADLGADRVECDSVTLSVFDPSLTYLWSDATTAMDIDINQSGNYAVTVTNSNNCTARDTVNITISNSPQVVLANDTTICSGQTVTLASNLAGTSYLWSNGTTDSTLLVNNSNIYGLTVTNTDGCTGSDVQQVTVNSPLTIELGGDQVLCQGGTYLFDAQVPNVNYNWTGPNAFTGNTQSIIVGDTGTYYLTITDQFGCSAEDSVGLTQSGAQLTADFLVSTDLIAGDTLQFINLSYPSPFNTRWDFGDGFTSRNKSPAHPYFVADNYTVKMVVENGACRDSLIKTLNVAPRRIKSLEDSLGLEEFNDFKEVQLYPNPNNGSFKLGIELYKEEKVMIDFFNINGQHVGHDEYYGRDMVRQYNHNNIVSGYYFVRIYTNRISKTLKFIVTR